MNSSRLLWSVLIGLIVNCQLIYAKEFLPAHIYQLDDKFTPNIILVEKSTHRLFIYERSEQGPRLVKSFPIATGLYQGNKFNQGDKRTPEGIYVLEQFHSSKELHDKYGEYAKMYGAGAFTSNYPNVMDKRLGKNGGGIWLHSTDDESRISKGLDSRGCVVVVDKDLKEISNFINLQSTPMVIVQNINFQEKSTWEKNKNEIQETVNDWIKAWQYKDFKRYISYYHPKNFHDNSRGNFNAFKQYKKAVFSRDDKPAIRFENVSILNFEDYAVVQMQQNYSSAVINDVGRKILYLQKDEHYQWKIVAELWSKLNPDMIGISMNQTNKYFLE
jgi:murein L,D-transpeptidase YafK